MKERLNKIREKEKNISLKRKIINTSLILFLGIILGLFSKWIDSSTLESKIGILSFLDYFDLGNRFSELGIWLFLAIIISIYSESSLRASLNVFLFFLGMTVSYHLYTVLVLGFNPVSYMKIWYTLTILSPILAFITWYSKGKNIISIIISSIILTCMFILSFSFGLWYFDTKSLFDTLIFIGTIIVLYEKPMNTFYSLITAVILSYILKMFNIY